MTGFEPKLMDEVAPQLIASVKNGALYFFLNDQPDALIIQIYSVIKLYMFWASSLPIIRSFLLYIWQW
jgi:hypothetical protein